MSKSDLTEAHKKALLLNPTWYSACSADFMVTPKKWAIDVLHEKAKAAMQKEEDENVFSSIIGKLDLAKTLTQLYKEDFLYGEAFPFIDNSTHQTGILNPAEIHVELEAWKARMYYPGDGSRWSDL